MAISAAAPLPPDLNAKLAEALGVPVLNLYGMSESPYLAMTPPDREVQPGAVGRALCEGLGIVDLSGRAVAAGTTGEIVTRGAHVFPGYLDDPTATAAAFLPGGWFRTGDVGYFDENGVLFLTGRLNEIINRGGEKVAPADVDAALLAHPDVAEAAAFGIPDARLGEEVAAAVVLRPGATVTARELRRSVANLLAPHKVPRRIWIVDELPRTATGKVQRRELSRRFGETRWRSWRMIDTILPCSIAQECCRQGRAAAVSARLCLAAYSKRNVGPGTDRRILINDGPSALKLLGSQ